MGLLVRITDSCLGIGACENLAPEIFNLGDDIRAQPVSAELADHHVDLARQAADACPMSAIELHDD